jgi:Holliday junction resolvase RusA-like endonuclease
MEPLTIGTRRWFAIAVNPEPWAVGPLSVGRKNGKLFPMMGRNQQLDAFKRAVAEAIGEGHEIINGPVKLKFYFWRNRPVYVTPSGRLHRKHDADVTNMQKATEDALQGILFVNDKDTNDVHSKVVEQGADVAGKILLSVEPNTVKPSLDFSSAVWDLLNKLEEQVQSPELVDDYSEGEDLF